MSGSPTPDKFGRTWPEFPVEERCGDCGQPTYRGECAHERLRMAEVVLLGGRLSTKEMA